MNTTSIRRRLGASIVTVGLAAGVLAIATAPTASATADVKQSRVAGTDRFATAAAIAKAEFPAGSSTVLVASGRAFPDALAGSSMGLPILLTEKSTLPTATSKALTDLKASKAIILGGTAAVSDAVKKKIEDSGVSTSRTAGNDRYETAGAIAATFAPTDVAKRGGKSTAIIATGKDFADALAGGPLASAPTTGAYPVLLVNDTVPPATKKAIADLAIKQVVILGGTGPVSPAVEAELETETGNQAIRLAGSTRYGTATKIADAAIKDFGLAGKEVLLANARVFADALAGGPLGALRGAPILLTDATSLNDEPTAWLISHSATVATVTALGGTAAIADSTLTAAEKAAETPPTVRKNEKYVVAPTATTNVSSGGTVTYTAKVGTDIVDIVLLPCAYVQTTSAGDTVFANSNRNTIADGGAEAGSAPDTSSTGATISAINGTPTSPVTPDDYADVQKGDSSGNLTFDVAGPGGSSSECVIPVVFDDADQSNAFNVSTANPGVPSEAFGTGGQAVFSPAEASDKAKFIVDVRRNDEGTNSFIGCQLVNDGNDGSPEAPPTGQCQNDGQASYLYDANDVFKYDDGTTESVIDLATFEAFLTNGDDVTGTYAADPAGVSTFRIYSDEAPEAPTRPIGSTATQDSSGVHFTIIESSRSTVDEYWLFRMVKSGSTCPTSLGSYTKVGSVADTNTGTQNPTAPLTLTDPSPAAGTTYCYAIASYDYDTVGAAGDVGPPTAPETVTTTAGANGAPVIVQNGANGKGGASVAVGDVHTLTFDQALAATTPTTASYTVTGTPLSAPFTVTCNGTSAICSLSPDAKTLRVSILTAPSTPTFYPLTITALNGIKDASGTRNADLANSDDTTIENSSVPAGADTTRPTITAANISHGGADSNWGVVGDVLDLTFSEPIVLNDADGALSQDQVTAILGHSVTYATGSTVTATVLASDATGKTLRLTVGGANLSSGIQDTASVPGSSNPNVTDTAGNPQAAASGAVNPTTTDKP
jgi:putative cell wall-binding protein